MLMDIVEKIKEWGIAFLPQDVFVVDIEFKPGSRKLSVYLDADEALTIEQCRQFNRHISEKLDELDYGETPYTLEVSSPGVDKPLLFLRQYYKHIGRELAMKLKAQNVLIGKLLSIDNEIITLLLKDEKKAYQSKTPTEKQISYEDIEASTVLVSFS
jgi:ribosome maturation factor RimP